MTRHYQDGQTRRLQIAEAALRTLVEDGVDGFTTRAVAARVGITDGTVFRHFANKVEIVLAAMDMLEAEIDASLQSSIGPTEDIAFFFRHRAQFVGSTASVGRLIFSEGLIRLAGPQGRERIVGWRQRSLGFLHARLRQLHDDGMLAAGLDEASAALLVQGVLLTFAMSAALADADADLDERVSAAWLTLTTVLFTPAYSTAP